MAKAYVSEAALKHFTKGIRLAKEIGNEVLVCNAYQKNAMIASTNGMNEIALIYSIRTYQYIQNHKTIQSGRTLSAMGYNLSALGYMDEAAQFYGHAIAVFYELSIDSKGKHIILLTNLEVLPSISTSTTTTSNLS